MNKIVFTLLLSFFISTSYTQSINKARNILKKVEQQIQSYETIQADFTFILENKQEEVREVSEGKLWLKGHKYKVEIMDYEIFCNSQKVWTYIPEMQEVNITEPDEDDESIFNPSRIFSLHENKFTYKYIEERAGLHKIDLFPKDLDVPYARIKLKINANNYHIANIKYQGKDGIDYTVIVEKFIANMPMKDNLFIFDSVAHPDVEVIDMR